MVDAAGCRIQKLIAPVHVSMDRTTALTATHGDNGFRRMRKLLVFVAAASMVGAVVLTFTMTSSIAGPRQRLAAMTGRVVTGQPAEPFGIESDGKKATNCPSPLFVALFPEP